MRYIYPPRPKNTIPPSQLSQEEQRGCWLWQPKYDGDRCIVVVDGQKVQFGNRHHKFHPSNKLKHLIPQITSLALPTGSACLDGELLNGSILVLFDVLEYGGKYLIGKTQVERLEILELICGKPVKLCEPKVARQVSSHLWLSLTGTKDFLANFQELTKSNLVEGLLLRQPNSILDQWGSTEYEVEWQLRCRKSTKNYRF